LQIHEPVAQPGEGRAENRQQQQRAFELELFVI
jgi:hypothetical protein